MLETRTLLLILVSLVCQAVRRIGHLKSEHNSNDITMLFVYWISCLAALATALDDLKTSVQRPPYHELSKQNFTMNKNEAALFGYSIAYQKEINSLIVGSPLEDIIGQVYTCSITGTECINVRIETGDFSTDKAKTMNHFSWLGATVNAGDSFFMACAPRVLEEGEKSSIAPNNKRPSLPRPYDEPLNHKRILKPTQSQFSKPPKRRRVDASQRRVSQGLQKSPPCSKTPAAQNILDCYVEDGLDFDDDDSVCDKTYDPLIAGDLSSSDTENEMIKVKKVKKQLFTPGKKSDKYCSLKKVTLYHQSPVTVEAIVESDKTQSWKKNMNNSKSNSVTKEVESNDLVTPEDLGLVPQKLVMPDLVTPEDLELTPQKIIIRVPDGQNQDVSCHKLTCTNLTHDHSESSQTTPNNNVHKTPRQLKHQNLTEHMPTPEKQIIENNISLEMNQNFLTSQQPEHQYLSENMPTPDKQIIENNIISPERNQNLLFNQQPEHQNLSENMSTPDKQVIENIISPRMNQTRPVVQSSTKKQPRKRSRNLDKWKKNIAKKNRLQGLSYVSTVAKKHPEVKARELKPPCQENCRLKCRENLTEERRLLLFKQFWTDSSSWEQRRQYIANNIEVNVKKYMKTTSTIETDRRKYTHTYTIPQKPENIQVCKTMFLNTFDVSEKFVRICISKKLDGGLTQGDQRGHHTPGNKTPEHVTESVIKHISSYPSYESHYKRENTNRKYLGPELNLTIMYKHYVEYMNSKNAEPNDIAKNWLYREIFNSKFNLSFKILELDTCDDCDRFKRTLQDTKEEDDKRIIEEKRNEHLEEAERRYNLKKDDKENCYNNNNVRVLFLDLQKCLPTPYLTNTQSFYLRKLWTLNLTIYEAKEKKANNYVWPETVAGRGGNEIASCLLKWAEENLVNEDITDIITWTDNCQGQNRNMMLVMAYVWLMQKYPQIKTMQHKFLLKGHTHMEVDHVHSIIERKKKQLATMEIAVPRDWAQFLRSCSGKNCFQVKEMTQDDFVEIYSLTKKNSGPFVLRKKNTMQEYFKISETVTWRFEREKPGILLYKTDFKQNEFKELNLVRKVGRLIHCPENLPLIRTSEKPISTLKYKDLMTLLQWIPKDFHSYYKNLKHSNSASDLPEED